MRYHVIHIKTDFAEEWQKDLFEQQLFDLGVDTIDAAGESLETDSPSAYYIPSDAWAQHADEIKDLCAATEGVSFLQADECEDKNWNAAWEAEHPIQELPLGIKIIPHCAFGAGHHETTSMLINNLLSAHLTDKNVLDHGTGTGVLAIFAKRLGAKYVLAVDIDDKSVENAKENAALNNVDIDVQLSNTVPPLQGEPEERGYHLILANIHRNILLEYMPAYTGCLAPGGELWLSGFYEEDCPTLIAAAAAYGLRHLSTHANGDWRMLVVKKVD